MYFHLGQRLVIHSVLEENQTKKCLFGGFPSITKTIKEYSQTTKKNGDFEDAIDQRYHNLDTWKWASGEEIVLGGTITNGCRFCWSTKAQRSFEA